MKKRCLIFAMVAAFLMLPLMAQAATEFTLGGYLKLSTGWTSNNQETLNFSAFTSRNNGAAYNGAYVGVTNRNHGKYMMSATGSRFNFAIKGPELWGAKITGLFEVDFDGQTFNAAAANQNLLRNASDTSQGVLRLRHAMFRLNWPETELMLGQYWGLLSEWGPDVIDGGAMCLYGWQSLREPQIRLTQKFAGGWEVAGAISPASNGRWGMNLDATDPTEGESSETPKVTGRVRYEKDLWGKAPYLGALKGFVAELGGSWYRTRHSARSLTGQGATTWGPGNYQANAIASGLAAGGPLASSFQVRNSYTNNWMVQGTFFLPVIPTYSKNLAGTMAILTNWWVGQGMSGWREDMPVGDRYWVFKNRIGGTAVAGTGSYNYEVKLMQRWGGGVQGTYYFNNEWYMSLNYGMNAGFKPTTGQNPQASIPGCNPAGYKYATLTDNIALAQMINANVWYRPIQALKLGLQYTFQDVGYYQGMTSDNAGQFGPNLNVAPAGGGAGSYSKSGYAHSLMFGGFFFF